MQKRIEEELASIEHTHQVKVIYACEAGSRASGLASNASDYDVRFLYLHPSDWYLSIQERRDVIEVPVSSTLDISGWDLRKALALLRKSNPGILEWLQSTVIYLDKPIITGQIKALAQETFSKKACMHHYFSMAKRNFNDFLKGDEVQIKRYFYVLRPILSCIWMEKKHTFPPLDFHVLLKELPLSPSLKSEMAKLAAKKAISAAKEREPKNAVVFSFLEEQLFRLKDALLTVTATKKDYAEELDGLFRMALTEAWKK
ncbi:nucleotidyltransferase domain-containing protein [Heyndrickxia acidicola]|uniref:Nucleotidyltransferase domain-containing protein n=1 Tax=Heyndrickxia acidicola TaxID=209389 RepID=A0ABU6MJ43_9BACI|nr:nucleotidyltransferase domain-containing protein [Heyndrickxia acidicola]MED1204683.1 nucleotidyltransferase domain-containing protein [Heyndrickxia acidicola]